MKKFTIGVTTHNEEATVSNLLDGLRKIDPSAVDLIIYDDCSTDRTKEVILDHATSRQKNFHAEFATVNNGTPSAGRTYIGRRATTEYTSLIDGDDLISPLEYSKLVETAPSGYDLILTTYALRGKRIGITGEPREIALDEFNVNRIFSGIGGKVYRTSLLEEFGPDPVKGRSDDVRLNMRIMSAGKRKIFVIPAVCYYQIESSRKSTRAASLNFEEIETRVRRHQALRGIYPIGSSYLESLELQLRQIAKKDSSLTPGKRMDILKRLDGIFHSINGKAVHVATASPKASPTVPSNFIDLAKHRPNYIEAKLGPLDEEIRRLSARRQKLLGSLR